MAGPCDVIIVGGGMGGLILAQSLSRKGLRSVILERQFRLDPPLRGENIQPNGLKILDRLGLLESIQKSNIHINHMFHFHRIGGGRLCTIDYRMLPDPYPYTLITFPKVILQVMLDRISEDSNIQIFWGTEFEELLWDENRVVGIRARRRDPDQPETPGVEMAFRAPLVVGADGVHSRVRSALGIPCRLKTYAHSYLTMVIRRPLDFGPDGRYYVGRREILGLFPAGETSLYLFYLVPSRKYPDQGIGCSEDLERFKQAVASIDPVIRDPLQEVVRWDQVRRMPCWRVRAQRWVSEGAVLMGDAAHAMNPHISQGRNQAMEDAMVLGEVIGECFARRDFSAPALRAFETRRRHGVEVLQRLADEQVFFWNAGDPLRTWIRDRVFRVLDQNARLRGKMLMLSSGLNSSTYSIIDRFQAAGLLPDLQARQGP